MPGTKKWYEIISIIIFLVKADVSSCTFYIYFQICKYNLLCTNMAYL